MAADGRDDRFYEQPVYPVSTFIVTRVKVIRLLNDATGFTYQSLARSFVRSEEGEEGEETEKISRENYLEVCAGCKSKFV